MQPVKNQQIVGGFNRQEPWAVVWIYKRFQPEVFTVVRRLLGPGSAAVDDIVAEIFAALVENRKRFARMQKIREFLFLETRNACAKQLKNQQKPLNRTEEFKEEVYLFKEDAVDRAEQLAVFAELASRAMDKLPVQCKSIFQLYYKDRLSNEEIAGRLNIAEKTVANQKALAMKILKTELRDKANFIFQFIFFI
jgi:RNA polymerase sigma-70 factor (ECF subfamily)